MSLTRRELLALAAGAPLAGCKRAPPIAGEIRGASTKLGHRLRDATPERASGPPRRVRVAIVGAGPSGLSAAWRLERAGMKDYAVFELERQPGGTSTFGSDGVVPYPWGAHYVPAPSKHNRALVALLDEMGAFEGRDERGDPRVREELLVREPEERLFVADIWQEGLFPHTIAGAADRAELERFQREVDAWVAFRDSAGRRAFALPIARSSDDAKVTELDRQSAADWLGARGFRSKLLRWYVEYACRDDYGLALGDTSAWAMMFYFCARVPAPRQESAPFVSWPEGNGHLVRHLSNVAGARVKLGALVTDVVPNEILVEFSVFDAAAGSLTRWQAEHVILALPKFVVPKVLRPYRDSPPSHLREFGYGVWWVANIHLRRRPRSPGFPFAWDNVIYDSKSLGYVVATHQRESDYGPTVWTYYQPMVESDPARARGHLADMTHGQFVAQILEDLGPAHIALRDAIERIDVWRWGHAMVRPVPGFVWGGARPKAMVPFGRVHFAHCDLSGVALFEEAQDHGVRAAEEVLVALGREVESLRG